MICARATSDGVALDVELPPATAAYFDAEWLAADAPHSVPAIVVATLGHDQPDADAASVLVRIARDALSAVADRPAGALQVTGRGVLAAYLRELAPDGERAGGARPAAIIDTTGDPAVIVRATQHLCDLGVLVLAGEPLDRRLDMDLYSDVHVRGLRVRGIARPARDASDGEADPLPDVFERMLSVHRPGTSLPHPVGWYRVGSEHAGA